MHAHDLEKFGLSDKESKVYLAVLEFGPATVIQIAQRAGINRPTTYVQIGRLLNSGLVSSQERGKKTYFAAEPPERLQELIRVKQSEVAEQDKRLKEILPELQTIFDSAEERPKVRFYEGKAGIMAMADDIFSKNTVEIFTISSVDLFNKIFSRDENTKFEELRKRHNISVKYLYNNTAGSLPKSRFATVEDRWIPDDKFPVTSGIDIYQNKISAFALKGKIIGVIIESSEISKTMRSIFKLAWEAAEKYQNK